MIAHAGSGRSLGVLSAGDPKSAGGFSAYNPNTNQLRIAGIGSNPMNLGFKAQYNYWAPRTGFAYRVNDGTVIRGGVGMSYTPYEDNTWLYNYPVRANNAHAARAVCLAL